MGQAKRRRESDPDYCKVRRGNPPKSPRFVHVPTVLKVGTRRYIVISGRLYEKTVRGSKRVTDETTLSMVAEAIGREAREADHRRQMAAELADRQRLKAEADDAARANNLPREQEVR